MFTWKVAQTLTHSDQHQWDILTETVLGEPIHPGRRKGFQLSREALRLCLSELGFSREIMSIQLEGHGRLKDNSILVLSLSHTSSIGAAVCGPQSEYLSIGIDVESTERKVRPEIIQRISHSADMEQENIERWVVKEAVFKTCMNMGVFKSPIEFSSIEILPQKWQQATGLQGEWELHHTQGHVVAIAWIRT